MTHKEIIKRIGIWQKLLNLPEHSIDLEICTRDVIGDEQNAAVVQYPCSLTATIRLADDWLEEASDIDIEEALIHELIHIVLNEAWFDTENVAWDYSKTVLRERAINRLTRIS